MSKNFKPVNETKLSSLPFGEAWSYVYQSGKKIHTANIYRVKHELIRQIDKILRGHPDAEIKSGDSVYVLPGHPLPKTRIKEYLKSINAKLVDNVDKATIIAGWDEVYAEDTEPKQPNLTDIIFKINGLYNPGGKEYSDELRFEIPDIKDTTIPIMISRKAYDELPYMGTIKGETGEFITPLGMDIMYNILGRKLKVVTQDTLTSKAHSGIKLSDPDIYNSLDQMFSSSDRRDNEMALGLLFHADTTDAEYHIWKLIKRYSNIINRDYSKNAKNFRDTVKFSNERYINRNEKLIDLSNKGKLSNYILEKELPELLSDCKDKFSSKVNAAFFDIEETEHGFTVNLKEEFRIKEYGESNNNN